MGNMEWRGDFEEDTRATHKTPRETYRDKPMITRESLFKAFPAILALGILYAALVGACTVAHFLAYGHWPTGWLGF